MATNESLITATLMDLYKGKSLVGHNSGTQRKTSVLSIDPQVRNKQLIVKGQSQGTKLYPLTMIINGVNFSKSRNASTPNEVNLGHGERLYCSVPDINDVKVQVRCLCSDFYFTYQWWDKQEKALAGPAFPKYVRKTKGWPERNPGHIPGLCKHLMALTDRLIQLKIIKR